MSGTLFGQTLLTALLLASVYSLVALGLTLVFGLLDIVNFAHGQILLGGAYLTYALVSGGTGFWIAALVVIAAFVVAGVVLDKALFARVRAHPISGLLISVALISILEEVYREIWGINPLDVPAPLDQAWNIGSVVVAADRVMVIVATAVIVALLALFIQRTTTGRAMRATAQNAEAATLMGIPVERVRTIAFAIGTGLAAVAGSLLSAVFPVEPALAEEPLTMGFIVLILGGAGSPQGAVLGAVVIAFVQAFATSLWSDTTAQIIAFALLILVLYFRPQGLIRSMPRESTL